MLELVNISNCCFDLNMFENSKRMSSFLLQHKLDGFEAMLYLPWDETKLPSEMIKGVHLRYWPIWLDFWRGNNKELLLQFGSEENIKKYYGGLTPAILVDTYRNNLKQAIAAGAEYVVFHVSHVRQSEMFTWNFSASDYEVVEATIELVNIIMKEVPSKVTILFENLWWPGLTLLDKKVVEFLFSGVEHINKGIMLDVGHLLNTNQSLSTQQQAVEYVIETIQGLGSFKNLVRGMHLHYSLSGDYVTENRHALVADMTIEQLMSHIMNIDQHRPFTDSHVRHLVEFVQPAYLVHEFIYSSLAELVQKVTIQRQALGILNEYGYKVSNGGFI